MNIMILNWRSLRDPLAGGAEQATFEYARRWVERHGDRVIWLSPGCGNGARGDTIEGVDFEYIGEPLTRHIPRLLWAYPWFFMRLVTRYLWTHRGRIDVVIDQMHGLPYLTPLYVKERIVVFACEVAGTLWKTMYPFPIGSIGATLEKTFLLPYKLKGVDFVAISSGTAAELKHSGISSGKIQTVFCGVNAPDDVNAMRCLPKEKTFTMVFLNRIVKMKGAERAIELLAKASSIIPDARLWIIGSGEDHYIRQLKALCATYGIQSRVRFTGRVSEKEKFERLARAHVLLNPSYKEGWGLVNIEANLVGTPVVAFDVNGNRESVASGVSGFLCPNGNIDAMVSAIVEMHRKGPTSMRDSCIAFTKQFDWASSAEAFRAVLARA